MGPARQHCLTDNFVLCLPVGAKRSVVDVGRKPDQGVEDDVDIVLLDSVSLDDDVSVRVSCR